MKKRQINTRVDGVAADMQPMTKPMTKYNFPSLKVTVEADSYEAALEKAKEITRKKFNK